jgi:hypothetical protein
MLGALFYRDDDVMYTVVHRSITNRFIIAISDVGRFHLLPLEGHIELLADDEQAELNERNITLCWCKQIIVASPPCRGSPPCIGTGVHALRVFLNCRPSPRLEARDWLDAAPALSDVRRKCEMELTIMDNAACSLQAAWRTCISNPRHRACRDRLLGEYNDLRSDSRIPRNGLRSCTPGA